MINKMSVRPDEGFAYEREDNLVFVKTEESEMGWLSCRYLEFSPVRAICRMLPFPSQHTDAMNRIQSEKADRALKVFDQLYASLHDLFLNAEYYKSDARVKLGDCFMLNENIWEGEMMFLKVFNIERNMCYMDIYGITPISDTVEIQQRIYYMKRDALIQYKRVDPSVLIKFEKIYNMSIQSLKIIHKSALE